MPNAGEIKDGNIILQHELNHTINVQRKTDLHRSTTWVGDNKNNKRTKTERRRATNKIIANTLKAVALTFGTVLLYVPYHYREVGILPELSKAEKVVKTNFLNKKK